jgi:hypothetical protein
MNTITLAVSSYCFTIFAAATAIAAPQSASGIGSMRELNNSGTLMFRANQSQPAETDASSYAAAQSSCPRGAITLQPVVPVEAGTKAVRQEGQRFLAGLDPRIASLPPGTTSDRGNISAMTDTAEPAMPLSPGSDTEMFSFAEEITPVPEPRTWLPGLLAACTAAWMACCRTNMRTGRLWPSSNWTWRSSSAVARSDPN